MVIDGKHIASEILERLAAGPAPEKYMVAILVGDDTSSISFLAQKEKTAKRLGVDFRLHRFPTEITNSDLRAVVQTFAHDDACVGIIVQLPLPSHLDQHSILNAIPSAKDPDVLSELSLGAFYIGRSAILPPAVGAVSEILEGVSPNDMLPLRRALADCTVAVVGLGLLVGRPVAHWVMRRAKETILLRSTSNLSLLKKADVVISGVGKAAIITPAMLAEGACVIDFGYDGGKGDFAADGTAVVDVGSEDAIWYTPTPGGTGPLLVAKLFENFYTLNRAAIIKEKAVGFET